MLKTFIASLAIVTLTGCVSAPTQATQDACTRYNNGDALMVLSAHPQDDSEFYADWSYYLNGFEAKHKAYTVLDDDAQIAKTFEPYSVLFVKKGQPAYLLEKTVEPQFYDVADRLTSGKKVAADMQSFMPEEVAEDKVAGILCR
ncbi:hypothetical protein ACKC9G_06025 [Pokkaliibacter sp. CJK22405]|uniref:hypothetical protein n=1 Tax=Pokkaliibacter sp. CJK22405 TaxID=3384615 RepID=UPI0039856A49